MGYFIFSRVKLDKPQTQIMKSKFDRTLTFGNSVFLFTFFAVYKRSTFFNLTYIVSVQNNFYNIFYLFIWLTISSIPDERNKSYPMMYIHIHNSNFHAKCRRHIARDLFIFLSPLWSLVAMDTCLPTCVGWLLENIMFLPLTFMLWLKCCPPHVYYVRQQPSYLNMNIVYI